MKPVPENISEDFSAGAIVMRDHSTGRMLTGEHVILTGTVDAFKAWFKNFPCVWVGVGSMMMQEFSCLKTSEIEFKEEQTNVEQEHVTIN
jgi:hypothetical protein